MTDKNDIQLIEIFAGELWKAVLIQRILKGNQIKVFNENELMGSIASWGVAPGGVNPVKIIISSADYERAITILEELNKDEPLNNDEERGTSKIKKVSI